MQQIGGYQIQGEIARGGMGVVYKALDLNSGRAVAIKVMLDASVSNPKSRQRFDREAEALQRVEHPNVVRLFDYDQTSNGLPYIAMELVEGESLQERLDADGALPPHRALRLFKTLCEAVSACHAAGVLHRDLKPENVLVAQDGTLKLTDFGLVFDTDPATRRTRLTEGGKVLGSPGYWAPEQAQGELSAIGERTDVYGLGATLFALLTGQPPHDGETLPEILNAVLEEKPRPSSINPSVPGWLDQVVGLCLAIDPDQRFASVADLQQALAKRDDGGPRRGTAGAWAAAVVLILGLGAAVAIVAMSGAPSRATVTPIAPSATNSRLDRTRAQADRLTEAIQLHPQVAANYDNRGRMRAALGDLEGAVQDYSEAIRLQPDLAGAFHNRGITRETQGDFEAAFADFKEAIRLGPNLSPPHYYRGRLWLLRGRRSRAVADLRRAFELDPTPYMAIWYALAAEDPAPLARLVDGPDWPAALARFCLDRISEGELLARANSAEGDEQRRGQLCEAYCYMGLRRDLAGYRDAARAHYEACLGTQLESFLEYGWASARLAQWKTE